MDHLLYFLLRIIEVPAIDEMQICMRETAGGPSLRDPTPARRPGAAASSAS